MNTGIRIQNLHDKKVKGKVKDLVRKSKYQPTRGELDPILKEKNKSSDSTIYLDELVGEAQRERWSVGDIRQGSPVISI